MKAKILINWRTAHPLIYLQLAILLFITHLIYQCHLYDLRCITLILNKFYFSKRNLYIFQTNNCSTLEKLYCGAPQGSVFGPLLFLTFIKNLPYKAQHSECIFYADDLHIFGIFNETKEPQKNLEKISEWMEIDKNTANKGKTKNDYQWNKMI